MCARPLAGVGSYQALCAGVCTCISGRPVPLSVCACQGALRSSLCSGCTDDTELHSAMLQHALVRSMLVSVVIVSVVIVSIVIVSVVIVSIVIVSVVIVSIVIISIVHVCA